MKRAWVPSLPAAGSELTLDAAESHHLLKVRRARPGDRIELIDGRGGLVEAEIVNADRDAARVRVGAALPDNRESPLTLTLALAVPQQRAVVDELLPGLVQLGVDSIYLAAVEYGGALKQDTQKYQARLTTIARNALKQCGRARLPRLTLWNRDWPALCETLAAAHEAMILCHPSVDSGAPPPTAQSIALLVGPEGGFTDGEAAAAIDRGAVPVSLGPRVLKMETAAICAAHWAQTRYGDM